MFEINSKKVDVKKGNIIKKKHISLGENIDCFILVSGDNENFVETLINNILDSLIDKIGTNKTYKEFSIALENINSFIKTWKLDGNDKVKIDAVIGILNKNNFIFSNIGKSSCYLLKNKNEFIELTDKKENKDDFSFISSGDLKNDETVVMSTSRILDYLSNEDIADGLNQEKDIQIFNKNIKNILLEEILEKNILFISIKYKNNTEEEKTKEQIVNLTKLINHIKNLKLYENIIKHFTFLIKKVKKSPKKIKNIVFITGIIISLIFMYQILHSIVSVTTNNSTKESAKTELTQAENYINIASENIANKDNFELNIKNAEDMIDKIREKKIFLKNIEQINDKINILKKQFNKIETFYENNSNLRFDGDLKDYTKIIKHNKQPFIINKKGISGPIIQNKTPKNYTFNSLEKGEFFVDATSLGSDIFLLTNFSKIVRFTKNGHFSYSDVIGQKAWEKSREIESYGQNIYLISKENSQIFKHSKTQNKFGSAKSYLKKEDLTQIGKILSIGIDGGFYILKEDLSIVKFFKNPKYRLEKVVINKLPNDYNKIDNEIDLKSRSDLNYLYMLLNNKIWVFKPNSKDYRNTKGLTYIGQIEGNTSKIKDFFVNYDGEIYILNEKGIYEVDFEISDDKLILR